MARFGRIFPVPRARGKPIVSAASFVASYIPYAGLVIYETDTKRMYVYNGSVWEYLAGGTPTYSARMYRSAAGASVIGTNTFSFDTVDYDNNSNITIGSSQYTAPLAGLYDIRWRLGLVSNASNTLFYSWAAVNGTEAIRGQVNYSAFASNTMNSQGAEVIALAAGDIVTILYNAPTSALNFDVGKALAYFSARRL